MLGFYEGSVKKIIILGNFSAQPKKKLSFCVKSIPLYGSGQRSMIEP